jgi:hypothetical protein
MKRINKLLFTYLFKFDDKYVGAFTKSRLSPFFVGKIRRRLDMPYPLLEREIIVFWIISFYVRHTRDFINRIDNIRFSFLLPKSAKYKINNQNKKSFKLMTYLYKAYRHDIGMWEEKMVIAGIFNLYKYSIWHKGREKIKYSTREL